MQHTAADCMKVTQPCEFDSRFGRPLNLAPRLGNVTEESSQFKRSKGIPHACHLVMLIIVIFNEGLVVTIKEQTVLEVVPSNLRLDERL